MLYEVITLWSVSSPAGWGLPHQDAGAAAEPHPTETLAGFTLNEFDGHIIGAGQIGNARAGYEFVWLNRKFATFAPDS